MEGDRGSAKHVAVGLRGVGIYCATAPMASESASQICEMAALRIVYHVEKVDAYSLIDFKCKIKCIMLNLE